MHVLTKTRYDAVVQLYGNLADALRHVGEPFLTALGCRDDGVRDALLRLEEFDVAHYAKRLAAAHIRFLTIADPDYPAQLRELPDPPVFLYAQGDLSLCARPSVAVVGTRDMTKYGKRAAEMFTEALCRAGLATVSGLARGVDTAVADETLRCGGAHIAVLGHGMGLPSQRTGEIAKRVVASGGLVLSEFPLDYAAGTYTFPARNRIIAGLSQGTIVCEAPEKSGALITAEFALEQGKDVFAVPGPITEATFAGSHRLIARGHAKLVAVPEDVLEDLGVVQSMRRDRAFTGEDPVQRAVWNALSQLPMTADTLAETLALEAPAVGVALTMMELAGDVRPTGEGGWVRA